MNLNGEESGINPQGVFFHRRACTCLPLFIFFICGFEPASCQQNDTAKNLVPDPEAKRIFWIIPNFRTSPVLVPYQPIGAREKFHIAALDSFDRGTFALGALFGAEAQLTRTDPSFGDGVSAYARYFATAYADYAIGDLMTEAIFPVLLHQDPRYSRRGTGGRWSRLGYAAGQVFWTRGDSGRGQFNFSEIAGTPRLWRSQCPTIPRTELPWTPSPVLAANSASI
jgi:hypothetical protein